MDKKKLEKERKIRNLWARGDPEGPMLFKANLLGIKLRVERYPNSVCTWNRILCLNKGKEVYRITLDHKYRYGTTKLDEIDIGTRKEYFFNRKFRQYTGNKFCFVEYIDFWEKNKKFPSDKELDNLGLEKRIAEDYKKFAYKIADIKPQ